MSKYTIQLTPQMEAVLEELAESQGVPKSTVIRRAVNLMKFLAEERADGAKVKLEEADGTVKELVLENDLVNRA